MDIEVIQRRIQYWKGLYMVSIPIRIVRELDIKKGQYARFAVTNGKMVIKPADSKITTKDMKDADKNSDHLDYGEVPSHEVQLAEALGRDPKSIREGRNSKIIFDDRDRLERYKM